MLVASSLQSFCNYPISTYYFLSQISAFVDLLIAAPTLHQFIPWCNSIKISHQLIARYKLLNLCIDSLPCATLLTFPTHCSMYHHPPFALTNYLVHLHLCHFFLYLRSHNNCRISSYH